MFCGKCGSKLEDGARFCKECGASAADTDEFSSALPKMSGTASASSQNFTERQNLFHKGNAGDAEYGMEYDISDNRQALDNIFVEPDETLIAKLGNGFLINLLFRKPKKCSMMLTDRRLYLKGVLYASDLNSKTNILKTNILKTTEERILDLRDVTGTGLIYTQFSRLTLVLFILSTLGVISSVIALGFDDIYQLAEVLWFPLLLSAVFFGLKLIKSRSAYFFVDYAGGRIKIDAKILGLSDVQDFHKQIRRAKNALTERC